MLSRDPWTRAAMLALAVIVAPAAGFCDDGAANDVATAEPAAPIAAAPAGVVARVVSDTLGLSVEARFRIAAPHETVWAVLTDYDHIARFVPSLRKSRITESGPEYLMVEQVAIGRLLLFKRTMHTLLRVHEEPQRLIRFEDVLHQDFELYRGEWRIDDRGREVEVTYTATTRPSFSIPAFVARGMFQKTVRQLLTDLQKEIAARSALAERNP